MYVVARIHQENRVLIIQFDISLLNTNVVVKSPAVAIPTKNRSTVNEIGSP